MRVRVARSGRKLAAMVNASEPAVVGDRLLYLGLDDRGVELKIVAVPDAPAAPVSQVIHAMPSRLRSRS